LRITDFHPVVLTVSLLVACVVGRVLFSPRPLAEKVLLLLLGLGIYFVGLTFEFIRLELEERKAWN